MANTYTSLFYHIVFSTKNRIPYIRPEIEQRVWECMGGVMRRHKLTALQIGGVDDHIHALIMASPTFAPSQIAQLLKGDSSKWIGCILKLVRGTGMRWAAEYHCSKRQARFAAHLVPLRNDHLHLILNTPKWIHQTFPELSAFAWQEGYGAFTVSKSALTRVIRYIQNQRAHHQKQDYQAEYLEFLRRHDVEYDERYLWG